MRIVELVQGTPEWHSWRNSGIGSSDAAAICGLSKWTKNPLYDVWRQKVQQLHGGFATLPTKKASGSMLRGQIMEGIARRRYEALMGYTVPAVCGESEEYPFIRASLDGYNAVESVVAEYKAPNKDDHAEALAGRVPLKYVAQCDHQLLVSGARVLHYVSTGSHLFSPAQQFAVVSVQRDEQRLARLLETEQWFWWCVEEEIEPLDALELIAIAT